MFMSIIHKPSDAIVWDSCTNEYGYSEYISCAHSDVDV